MRWLPRSTLYLIEASNIVILFSNEKAVDENRSSFSIAVPNVLSINYALFWTVFLPRGNIEFSSLCRLFNNDASPQKERWKRSEG